MPTRLAFNYEPVRFDVDPPEDWQPSLRSQEEVDDLFWDQLLNKGKRAANTFMDFWYGSTAEEEAQTAMEELAALNAMPYGGPLIALVGKKTLGELLQRFRSQVDLEPSASPLARAEARTQSYGSVTPPEDTALHGAARWVSERYPHTMSHARMVHVDPTLKGTPTGGYIAEGPTGTDMGLAVRDNIRGENIRRELAGQPGVASGFVPSSGSPPFDIGVNPMYAGHSARLDPDNPLLTETAEAIDVLTHELTHAGQNLRHGSRQRDVLARDDWAENYVPFRATPEGESYWRAPAERRAHTAGLANQLHYLMDERRWADPGVVPVVEKAITEVIERRMPNNPGGGAFALKLLTEAASEGPAALRRAIQRLAKDVTDDKLQRGFELEELERLAKWTSGVLEDLNP
jgi:hypothetical protein